MPAGRKRCALILSSSTVTWITETGKPISSLPNRVQTITSQQALDHTGKMHQLTTFHFSANFQNMEAKLKSKALLDRAAPEVCMPL